MGEYELAERCTDPNCRAEMSRWIYCPECDSFDGAIPASPINWLGLNLETAAAMEITRQSYYRKGWENAMAIRGICEPLSSEAVEPYGRREEAHAISS